jgi:hypothetical protein
MCMSFSPSQALTMRSSSHERGGDGDGEGGGRLCLFGYENRLRLVRPVFVGLKIS